MIRKEYGVYFITCDCCGDQVGEHYETFQDAVDGRRDDPNIRTRQVDCEWRDTCHECEGRIKR